MSMSNGPRFRALSVWLLCGLAITFVSLRDSARALKPLLSAVDRRGHSSSPTSTVTLTEQTHDEEKHLPFDSLVKGNQIVGDVDFLLDYAVVGFAKCSTSATINWINSHQEAKVLPGESKDLRLGNPHIFAARLYHYMEPNLKMGYKNPGDIKFFHAIEMLGKHWPSTKLLIALRHPVLRFESFYNFRLEKGKQMPSPRFLIGECTRTTRGVCTDSAALHSMLARLGMTSMNTPKELQLFTQDSLQRHVTPIPNKIFLYTVNQFGDANHTRANIFSWDVQDFLGFQKHMPPIPCKGSIHTKNATTATTSRINICDSKYVELRRVLMKHSRAASTWIREYFLESSDVVVSSRDHFEALLEEWMHDPCERQTVLDVM